MPTARANGAGTAPEVWRDGSAHSFLDMRNAASDLDHLSRKLVSQNALAPSRNAIVPGLVDPFVGPADGCRTTPK
jgi:hypothetical protein